MIKPSEALENLLTAHNILRERATARRPVRESDLEEARAAVAEAAALFDQSIASMARPATILESIIRDDGSIGSGLIKVKLD